MKPAPFAYERAGTVSEAVGLLARHGGDAKLLAGGQSLAAMLNLRLARPEVLIDVNPIPGLSYLLQDGEGLRIGALTRHEAIERYPLALPGFELLQEAASLVGHAPIRSRGTFGGSLAHADPAAEWCLLALLFDAEIRAAGPQGERVVAAEDYFKGFLTTALREDEMVIEVRLPRGAQRAGIAEFARRHGDFAIVAAAVAVDLDENGRCTRARVVAGGVADTPLRLPRAEAVLEGSSLTGDVVRSAAAEAAAAVQPGADIHGSADYRRALLRGLVTRACERALAQGGTADGAA